jgi:hypothetical protein
VVRGTLEDRGNLGNDAQILPREQPKLIDKKRIHSAMRRNVRQPLYMRLEQSRKAKEPIAEPIVADVQKPPMKRGLLSKLFKRT